MENSAVATGLEKGQFSFQSQRKVVPKNVQTTAQLHFSSFILNKMSQGLLSGKLKWREYDGSLIAIYEEELSFGTKEA